jgi:hypothetical protein
MVKNVFKYNFFKYFIIAHVIPLFKNGDKSLPSNYRPVSLLSCVNKIFEKIVFKNIFNHLHKNKLLYKFQSDFIPGLSTTHQLQIIMKLVYNLRVRICRRFLIKESHEQFSRTVDIFLGVKIC